MNDCLSMDLGNILHSTKKSYDFDYFDRVKDLDFKERAHGDGIKISSESPEAFEEVFWKTFADEEEEELAEKFRIYVRNIMHKYKKKRYLSKNNQNIRRLELISSIFTHFRPLHCR